MRDFVGTVSEAGCRVFLVHARNAWLKGLSPKENREVPPLRYELVHRLKREFPAPDHRRQRRHHDHARRWRAARAVDGVMVGREAYHNPWWLADGTARFFGEAARAWRTREWVEERMVEYMAREAAAHGTPWSSIARHMLGLRHGLPGARRWRQVWSDHRLKDWHPREVMALAHEPAAATPEA